MKKIMEIFNNYNPDNFIGTMPFHDDTQPHELHVVAADRKNGELRFFIVDLLAPEENKDEYYTALDELYAYEQQFQNSTEFLDENSIFLKVKHANVLDFLEVRVSNPLMRKLNTDYRFLPFGKRMENYCWSQADLPRLQINSKQYEEGMEKVNPKGIERLMIGLFSYHFGEEYIKEVESYIQKTESKNLANLQKHFEDAIESERLTRQGILDGSIPVRHMGKQLHFYVDENNEIKVLKDENKKIKVKKDETLEG